MRPIAEDDLHAYADGHLPAAQRVDVEAWLAAHPEDGARVRAWKRQNRGLHEVYDDVHNEPVPVDLLRTTTRRQTRPRPWRAAAAVALALLSGGVGYGLA